MSALGPRAGGLRLIRFVLIAIALGTTINTGAGVVLFLFNADRADQICDLVVNTHVDRVKRYKATLAYLETPAGREHTALNDYIRVKSLPQTRAEVIAERENLPSSCVAGRRLPDIPK